MYELLGPHVNQAYGGIPEMVATWKPPVALILDHSPAWHWVKEQSPNTVMLGRWYLGEPPNFENVDPIQYARDETARILSAAASSPYDYIVGCNEPIVHSRKAMRNLALYDIERMKILAKIGKKAAVGGLASGNPSDMSVWEEYLPALEAAREHDAILHLHQYDWPTIGSQGVWNVYRHELLYDGCPDHGWAGIPEDLKPYLVVSEYGLDAGTVPGNNGVPVGWRGAEISASEYARQLDVGQRRLMNNKYVIGACIFCVGNASQQWAMFDYWPEVAIVAGGATPVYRKISYPSAPDEILGVDISHWQTNFGFAAAIDEGLMFAIMRSSIGLGKDDRFEIHWKRAVNRGLAAKGIYHYLTPGSVPIQARRFAQLALDHPANILTYPDSGRVGGYFLDVEHPGLNATLVRRFKEAFEDHSGLPLDYYTSRHMWNKLVGVKDWREFGPISWVADYRNVRRFAVPAGFRRSDVMIRQFTSNNGVFMSHNGRLDINRWVGPKERFAGT